MKPLTHSQRDHYLPACKDGTITFVSPELWQASAELWSFDPASGEERVLGSVPTPSRHEMPPKDGCDVSAQAGSLEACAKEEDLFLSRDRKPIGHFRIQVNESLDARGGTHGPCDTPILSLEWSPDGKWLLVGESGMETSSSAPQFDYYVVSSVTMKLRKVASADSALWLPTRDELVYTTPRDLAALPGSRKEHFVWVQQLMVFDPVSENKKAITWGLTNNVDTSLCRQ
jgi:hypothetical protein